MTRSPFRRQLPTYSPISAPGIWCAARAAFGARDTRAVLGSMLESEYGARVRLCGSGTDALTRAIGIADAMTQHRGIVAFPGYGCYDLATSAVGADVRIVLYDVDPDTLAPDAASVRRALEAGARVVVVAPLYGIPIDWHEMETLAANAGAMLIEDAAQAFGAFWRGRAVGSLGDISILSFGRGKGWTASHGGALLLRGRAALAASGTDALASAMLPSGKGMSDLVTAAAQYVLGRPSVYGLPASIPWLGLGETRYRPPQPSRDLTPAAASLLIATRALASAEVLHRRSTAAEYRNAIDASAGDVRMVHPPVESIPGYLRFPVRLHGGFAAFRNRALALALGVAPAYPSLLDALAVVRSRLAAEPSLPGATTIQRELVTLPTHSRVSPRERRQILSLLSDSAEHAVRVRGSSGVTTEATAVEWMTAPGDR